VHAVQPGRDTEIFMSAEPVHPRQPDPVPADIHDEPATGTQRCGNRHIRSSYARIHPALQLRRRHVESTGCSRARGHQRTRVFANTTPFA
jgi:hypothetical protein